MPKPFDEVVLVQVLCVREHDGAVLLRKNDESSGPSLAGLWAGLLDEVDDGETLEDTARRLASPLTLHSLKRVARFQFMEQDDPVIAFEHEMIAMNPSGALPDGCQWVPREQLNFDAMPADDKHWYGRVLDGELLIGDFFFYARSNRIMSHTVRAVDKLIDDEPAVGEKRYTNIMSPDGTDNARIRFVD